MKVAIIPARGNSVRIPSKNYRPFRGHPMLHYPIAAAKASGLFDMIVVSTDHHIIASIAFNEGCVILPRPTDDGSTGTQEIAARVLDQLELHGSAACVLYPCTPLLTADDIRGGWNALLQPALQRCFVRAVGPDGVDAGALYWGWIRAFRDRKPLDAWNTHDLVLPAERVCDVDTVADWERCEAMFDALRNTRDQS